MGKSMGLLMVVLADEASCFVCLLSLRVIVCASSGSYRPKVNFQVEAFRM